jgi:rare lipoprotein A
VTAQFLALLPVLPLLVLPLRKHAVVSWYGAAFHNRPTASTEPYSVYAMTAAHRSLPFGTVVRFQSGSRGVTVRINDRGPTIAGREFDLSREAFAHLADTAAGLVRVQWRIVKGDCIARR